MWERGKIALLVYPHHIENPRYDPAAYPPVTAYPEYVSQLLTKLQVRANLPQCRFHDLRHLCASIMLKQKVDVKVAQERLGHADISTTLNIYTHVLPSSAKEAAEKIGALVYA